MWHDRVPSILVEERWEAWWCQPIVQLWFSIFSTEDTSCTVKTGHSLAPNKSLVSLSVVILSSLHGTLKIRLRLGPLGHVFGFTKFSDWFETPKSAVPLYWLVHSNSSVTVRIWKKKMCYYPKKHPLLTSALGGRRARWSSLEDRSTWFVFKALEKPYSLGIIIARVSWKMK